MPLQRFAPKGALLGERIPATLTSGRDTPLHAEASWGRGRGGNVKQRGRPWSQLVRTFPHPTLRAVSQHKRAVNGSGKDLMARSLTRRLIAGTAPCLLPPGLSSPRSEL